MTHACLAANAATVDARADPAPRRFASATLLPPREPAALELHRMNGVGRVRPGVDCRSIQEESFVQRRLRDDYRTLAFCEAAASIAGGNLLDFPEWQVPADRIAASETEPLSNKL
jgi:hypothetical protein